MWRVLLRPFLDAMPRAAELSLSSLNFRDVPLLQHGLHSEAHSASLHQGVEFALPATKTHSRLQIRRVLYRMGAQSADKARGTLSSFQVSCVIAVTVDRLTVSNIRCGWTPGSFQKDTFPAVSIVPRNRMLALACVSQGSSPPQLCQPGPG